jgi:hypothetical protein
MTENLRKIEKLISEEWIVVRMSEVKAGDNIRIYDSGWDGPMPFMATKDAVLHEGVWGVEAKEVDDDT